MLYINCTDKNIQNLNTTRETSIPANCPNANTFTLNYNVIQKFYKKSCGTIYVQKVGRMPIHNLLH